jgi:hypothetical protein
VIAQRVSGVLSAVVATALQDRYDVIDECRQLVGQCRSHDGESVDGARVLPGDDVVNELFGRSNEMLLSGAPDTCWATSRKEASGRARAAA